MKNVKDYQIIIISAILLFFCACSRRIMPESVKDSTYSTYVKKDTVFIVSADSSQSQYIIECQKTSEGYKARIIQLLTQRQGDNLNTPTATIDNNVLTTSAYLREREIQVPVYRFYTSRVKSSVFVKITNVLTGWQWAQIYAGRLLLLIVGLFAGYRLLKRYTALKLP